GAPCVAPRFRCLTSDPGYQPTTADSPDRRLPWHDSALSRAAGGGIARFAGSSYLSAGRRACAVHAHRADHAGAGSTAGQSCKNTWLRWPYSHWLRGAPGWPPPVRSPPPSPPDWLWGKWLERAATRAFEPRWHRPRQLRAPDGRWFRALIHWRALA